MSDLLQRIADLKTQAKNRRDLKRYERAAALMKQAIDLAYQEYESTAVPELRSTLASELVDCWGILGGASVGRECASVIERWGHPRPNQGFQ